MADLHFACPQCAKLMAVGADSAGKKVRCPHCQEVIGAPAPNDEMNFNVPSGDVGDGIGSEKANAAAEAEGDFGFSLANDRAAAPRPTEIGANEPRPASTRATRSVVEHVTVTDESRRQKWAIAILVPYALVMTAFAIIFYVKYRATDADHPLSMIPDLDGEYRNMTQKNKSTSEHRLRFDPDTKLYASMITTLGQPIKVGDLQVMPLSIEQRLIAALVLKKGQQEPNKESSAKEGLILKVRLTNTSTNTTFYPTDPYFERRIDDKEGRSYQQVEAGAKRIYGGVLPFPPQSELLIREWVDGQEHDNEPLKPQESRETVIASPPRAAVAVSEAKDKCLWRLQFRSGLVPFRGKEYAVSSVIGVQFAPSEVIQSNVDASENKRKS